ncbi:hypothetical protein CDCA_CDCA04G1441 [Cyanidium caldarium]|uniref:3-dehydroquinate synthase, chloroplastic n=1 Tax=Cyanidium caldarium TaxID=2771 RepID=A0AAV9ITB4_CYACA|nr:hypothetical protein CDCA_CDCA04G1441 [Cyanidium caldarium]
MFIPPLAPVYRHKGSTLAHDCAAATSRLAAAPDGFARRRRATPRAPLRMRHKHHGHREHTVLEVRAPSKTYPILFYEKTCMNDVAAFAPFIKGRAVLIVTNDTVATFYLERLRHTLDNCPGVDSVEVFVMPDGEEYKNMRTLNAILDMCAQARLDRQCALVALGGGVVGDVTGFAASVYLRGVPFIQVPTTLLAMVDSAVGGKTAVNHPMGKNLIGTFYQPEAVIADMSTLNTLDDRQLSAGIAEVIKYGLIRDATFLEWCEANVPRLMARDPAALRYAAEQSCRYKADVVAADERENGLRAILNLGHTFGHAIEAGTGYGSWLHGEAVATGMAMAAEMSRRLGHLTEADVRRVEAVLTEANLPVRPPPSMTLETFLAYMASDKKVVRGKIRLVLLERLGQAVVTADYDRQVLVDTIEYYRKLYDALPRDYERRLAHLRLPTEGERDAAVAREEASSE